tara:strand:+ start:158 stop:796 length:639 start_codon:yes stop_codon:yes gene_type:complete
MFDIEKYKEIKEYLKKKSVLSQIIAISKNHPKDSVIQAIKSGVYIFGENRVLEAKNKFLQLKEQHKNLELHLTGPLQSNKVKEAISIFDVFHTLDREKIALEFFKNNEKLQNKKIFIQVNTGKESNKSGIHPENINEFVKFCVNDLKLKIVGLMCIPPIDEDPKIHFKLLKSLNENNKLAELSIGMSNDYLDAIQYNPTYIRLGTILFGRRN